MTKSERTRQFIVEKTAPVFNCKGFSGTSLKDLTDVTGLSKGALYGNFTDKEDIAAEAFRYAIKKVKAVVTERVNALSTARLQLFALFEFYAEYVFSPPVEGGCPLLNASVEVDDHHVSMRRVVVKELLSTVNFIQALIDKGISAKEFIACESRTLAYTIFCVIEGAIMVSRVERSREPMEISVDHCKKLINQISINNNEA